MRKLYCYLSLMPKGGFGDFNSIGFNGSRPCSTWERLEVENNAIVISLSWFDAMCALSLPGSRIQDQQCYNHLKTRRYVCPSSADAYTQSIRLRWMRSRSTHSQRAKYLISIWRVHIVHFCAFPIAVQPSLSLYAIVTASWGVCVCETSGYGGVRHAWGMLRSQRILRTKRDMRPTSQAAMNSASVVKSGKVGWNFVL